MAYTDQAKIEDFLQRTLTQDEVDLLVVLLPSIKTWIDDYTSSTFDTAVETTRRYDGGGLSIDIDPAQDITEVALVNRDGTESYSYTDGEEYIKEPINATIKNEIRRHITRWPRGAANMAVTAKFTEYDFANSKVPDDIVTAATRIAAGIIKASSYDDSANAAGNIKKESLEGHTVEYLTSQDGIQTAGMDDPIVSSILSSRRDVFIG